MTGGLCLTFDDRNFDDWLACLDLFERFGARATFFVSGFSAMAEDNVQKALRLAAAGHEIGHHSVNHVRSTDFLAERSVEDYLASEIRPDIAAMARHGLVPASFAYPFNRRTAEHGDPRPTALDTALWGAGLRVLRTLATTDEQALHEARGNSLLFARSIDIRDPRVGRSLDDVLEQLAMAAARGRTLVCYAHRVCDEQPTPISLTPGDLEAILERACKLGLIFRTASSLA